MGGLALSLASIFPWLLVLGGLVGLRAWAKRGDGRTDLRRCPRCWYDMARLEGLRCPECGHEARNQEDLFRARPRRRLLRGASVALVVLIPISLWSLLPAHWTRKTPPIVLRGLLAMQGSPPMGPAGVPQPRGGTAYPNHGWHNLVWAHDVGLTIDACLEHAITRHGKIGDDEFADLAAKLSQLHEWYDRLQVMPEVDAWPVERAKMRAARAWRSARAEHGDADPRTIRIAWVLSEAQFAGSLHEQRPDWTMTPEPILEQALRHPSATVRDYGIARLANRVQLSVIRNGALRVTPGGLRRLPPPPFREIVDEIAERDPDATTRTRARDLQSYWDALNQAR